jgi:hypothetical protein
LGRQVLDEERWEGDNHPGKVKTPVDHGDNNPRYFGGTKPISICEFKLGSDLSPYEFLVI